MPGSVISRPGGQINPQQILSGVRYITEDVLHRAAGGKSLDSLTVLNLAFSSIGGKKIKYIENLDKMKKLHTLSFSNNCIEKIEKLEALTKLKDLDLSYNSITKIEGLEKLNQLVSVNLDGNQIELIPAWVCKKLKALRQLKLAKNNISLLQELRKLRDLPNLTYLTVSDNPVADLPHYRSFLIFHIRSLDVLDGRRVTNAERADADQRFAQEEIEVLQKELSTMERKYDELQSSHNKSVHDLEVTAAHDNELHLTQKDMSQRIRQLQADLVAKEELVMRKQAELSRANQKHYELEQELAFFKIESKFTSLHRKPDTPSISGDGDSLVESPYIGKTRHAKDQPAWPLDESGQPRSYRPIARPPDHPEAQRVDAELAAKQHAIRLAEQQLAELDNRLLSTQDQVAIASQHLAKVTATLAKQRTLGETEKKNLEDRLQQKRKNIAELENIAQQLLERQQQNDQDISDAEKDLSEIADELEHGDIDPQVKEDLDAELAERSRDKEAMKEIRDKLERAIHDTNAKLNSEQAEAKQIEDRLTITEGKKRRRKDSDNDPELANIASEVKNYLQRGHEVELQNQRLKQQVAELTNDLSLLDAEASEAEKVKGRVAELERSLRDAEERVAYLQSRQEQEAKQTPRAEQLKGEVSRLMAEKKRLEDLLSTNGPAHEQDTSLQALQKENDRLKRAAASSRALSDAEILAKLDSFAQQLDKGQGPSTEFPVADPISRKLVSIQKDMEKRHKSAEREARLAKEEVSRLERQLANLSETLANERAQNASASSDSDATAMVDALKNEMEALRSEMAGEQQLKHRLRDAQDTIKQLESRLADAESAGPPKSRPPLHPAPKHTYKRKSILPNRLALFNIEDELDYSGDSDSASQPNRHGDLAQYGPDDGFPSNDHFAPVESHDELYRDGLHDKVASHMNGPTPEAPWSAPYPHQLTSVDPRVAPQQEDARQAAPTRPYPSQSLSHPLAQGGFPSRRPDNITTSSQNEPHQRQSRGHAKTKQRHHQRGENQAVSDDSSGQSQAAIAGQGQSSRYELRDPRVAALADDLGKAEHEIARLNELLVQRERDLEHELSRSNRATAVIEQQRRDIEQLLRDLEHFRSEADRLAQLLKERAQYGQPQGHQGSVFALQQGHPRSDQALQQAQHMGQSSQQLPMYAGAQPIAQGTGPARDSQQELSPSFIQGPSFRPGSNRGPNQGILTSTPYRTDSGHTGFHLQPDVGQSFTFPPQTQASNQMPLPANTVSVPPYALQPSGQPLQANYGTSAVIGHINTLHGTGVVAQQPVLSSVPQNVTYVASTNQIPVCGACHSQLNTLIVGPQTTAVASGSTTPVKTVLLTNQPEASPAMRSILRKAVEALACNVPEHHDLEDRYSKLREKYKAVRECLKHGEDRKDYSQQVRAAKRLKSDLQERHRELESLDLAITRQKTELVSLQRTALAQEQRPSSLTTEGSDDSERMQEIQHYLQTEVECLEETIKRRRAELLETNDRLQLCRSDLDLAKKEARDIVEHYEEMKDKLELTEHEHHALEAKRVQREEEVAGLMNEVKKLLEGKEAAEESLNKIDKVTKERSDLLVAVSQRLVQTEASLSRLQQTIQQQTAEAERHLLDIKEEAASQIEAVKRSEQQLQDHYDSLKNLKATEKRSELSSLDKLEQEVKGRLGSRQFQLDKFKNKVEEEQELLHQLDLDIEEKEEQLSVLKSSLASSRSLSADLLKEISERKRVLKSITDESNFLERELTELREKHHEASGSVDALEQKNDVLRSTIETLKSEKDDLLKAVSLAKAEGEQLQSKLKYLQDKLAETLTARESLDDEVSRKRRQLEQLETSLSAAQSKYNDAKFEKENTESELTSMITNLKETKSNVVKLRKHLKDLENKKATLTQELEDIEAEKTNTERTLRPLREEYQQLASRSAEQRTLLSNLQMAAEEVRQDVDRLEDERTQRTKALKDLTVKYDQESLHLTTMTERAETELCHMRDQQMAYQKRVNDLAAELSRLSLEMEAVKQEHGDLKQLSHLVEHSDQELRSERNTNADLLRRLSEVSQRLQARKDALVKVKRDADEHVASLTDELGRARKETRQVREKSESEIEDLELIAQQHSQRADRLERELMDTRDRLALTQAKMAAFEHKLNTENNLSRTLADLRQDIQEEVTMGMAELERSRAEALSELEELKSQKSFITREVLMLKENLGKLKPRQEVASLTNSPSPSKLAVSQQKHDAEQQAIRAKMHEQMRRHLEAMEGMKAQSLTILSGLQDRVVNLQDVLSESTGQHQKASPVQHLPERDNSK